MLVDVIEWVAGLDVLDIVEVVSVVTCWVCVVCVGAVVCIVGTDVDDNGDVDVVGWGVAETVLVVLLGRPFIFATSSSATSLSV